MKYRRLFLVTTLLLASCTQGFAQTKTRNSSTPTLRNADVLRMYRSGLKPREIIAKILTSGCNFDTFPPVLKELKLKGLPDTVILAMMTVPYGPPSSFLQAEASASIAQPTAKILVPAGTKIEIATAYPISSADAEDGDQIVFLVSRRVLVNGLTVIERGAKARAHLIKIKRASGWGRGGSLYWALDDVEAVDGSRLPVRQTGHVEGKNRSKAVVAAAIATGALLLPYAPPVGLIWALKKGDEAVLDESRKSLVSVRDETDVVGLLPKQPKVVFHPVEKLKAAEVDTGKPFNPSRESFKATPLKKN
jgi:hypothetical protein